MKKFLFFLIAIYFITIGCKNAGKKPVQETKPVSQLDSLLEYIDQGHMDGMGKIGRLHNTKKTVQAMIDSISHLPANIQKTSALFVEALKTNIKDLDYADMAMDKWMMEYSEDSASSNENDRIKYLSDEKSKVEKVRAAIHNSLQKADSLLKVKF